LTFVLSRISPLPKSRRTISADRSALRNVPIGVAIAFGTAGSMLKIHRTRGRTVVLTIIGQLGADNVSELCQLVDAEPVGGVPVLELTDLVLADREAVRFLRDYEARGRVVLRNCPGYVRTWMAGEHDHS
jgi:hypothetical protein